MSELFDSDRRDWRTPVPLTGKPVVKTYFDWTHYRWRTEVCILLGVRETAPGVPMADRPEHAGKSTHVPNRERKDLTPQGARGVSRQGLTTGEIQPETMRWYIHAFLRENDLATSKAIYAALPTWQPASIRAALHNDPLVQRVGGTSGSGRREPGAESKWRLRPEAQQSTKEADAEDVEGADFEELTLEDAEW